MAKRKDVVPVKKTNLPAPEALKASLATAKTTGDVKPVHTAAKALKAAAKVAGNRQDIAKASEIVWRAERKLGQLMAEQKITVGVNKGGKSEQKPYRDSKNPVKDRPPTLAEAGIDKNLAYRARSEAREEDEGEWERDLKGRLDEILNPYNQEVEEDERKERRRVEQATPEYKAAREADRRRSEEERRENEKWEEEQHSKEAAEPVAEIILPKRGTQSAAPEIISPTFTAKGAVNQTRFAQAMRSVKQGLRFAYALSDRATFFKHARDMLDDLEREVVQVTAEASAHQRATEPVH